jgi:hypothetical protein
VRLKAANKILRKAEAQGIEATAHRFGNRNDYAVDFPWVRTLYRIEHANLHLEAEARGEFTEEYKAVARIGWELIAEVEQLLGLPHYVHTTIL